MTTQTTAPTYLDRERLPFPFCPGCSHGRVLHQLDAALSRLALDPRQIALVTDIGCVGLSDRSFTTNAFHGLHGRSITYATGLKLARPDLNVVVLMGDGGAGIGGNHLLHAARRNIGITVVVFNNFNFGMTGGQHSPTTPIGARTPTTFAGQWEQPLDLCATALANGAGFVARTLFNDPALADILEAALRHPGFALVDVWELCVRYARSNRETRDKLPTELLRSGAYPSGILAQNERPEYTKAYQEVHQAARRPSPLQGVPPLFPVRLARPIRCLVAGSAGARVRSSATLLGLGGVLAGLWATQRDEYPVTVAAGHSISQVILSPEEVLYTGFDRPDWAVVLTPEGLSKVRHSLQKMDASCTLYLAEGLGPVETGAKVILLDLQGGPRPLPPHEQTLAALAAALDHSHLYPLEALREAIRLQGAFVETNLALVEMGLALPRREA
ncbi:MAG: thiamine pyrophosphate-dependent enzyme [Anaerolineae bacterium]